MKVIYNEVLRGGHALALRLKAGQTLKVTEASKCQVADFICYRADDFYEHVSPAHTRCALGRLYLKKGDCLYSNRRGALMRISDMSEVTHDILYPACDLARYQLDFGIEGYHRNCEDNFRQVLTPLGIVPEELAQPVNLFENAPVAADGGIEIFAPHAGAGDSVSLTALEEVVAAVSACPMDAGSNDTNGGATGDLIIEVLEKPDYQGLN